LQDAPWLLITNPKDARFLSPAEPLARMASSTHIRFLVFAPACSGREATPCEPIRGLSPAIARVSVSIDGEMLFEGPPRLFEDSSRANQAAIVPQPTVDCIGPLCSFAWNPAKYSSGLHALEVTVESRTGRKTTCSQVIVVVSRLLCSLSLSLSLP